MKEIAKDIFLVQYNLKYKEFNGTTNVLMFVAERFIFICDTFIYPQNMLKLKKLLLNKFSKRKFVVFNSHEDFDHFWGNAAFEYDIIISSTIAKNKMQLQNYSDERNFFKIPKLVFPNITFSQKLIFSKENIEFFYSPGHTIASASCFIKNYGLLFAGDNLEYPNPYYNENLIKEHIDSLEYYLRLKPKIIVPGHGDVQFNSKIIRDNISYLRDIENGR